MCWMLLAKCPQSRLGFGVWSTCIRKGKYKNKGSSFYTFQRVLLVTGVTAKLSRMSPWKALTRLFPRTSGKYQVLSYKSTSELARPCISYIFPGYVIGVLCTMYCTSRRTYRLRWIPVRIEQYWVVTITCRSGSTIFTLSNSRYWISYRKFSNTASTTVTVCSSDVTSGYATVWVFFNKVLSAVFGTANKGCLTNQLLLEQLYPLVEFVLLIVSLS